MKKLLAILLAAMMLLSFAACGESVETETNAPETNAPETTVAATDAPVENNNGCASAMDMGAAVLLMAAAAAVVLKKK